MELRREFWARCEEERVSRIMVPLKPWVWIRLLSKRTWGEKEVDRKLDLNFPGGAVDKNLPANTGHMGLISGPGRFHMPRGK